MTTLYELILKSAKAGLPLQNSQGAMPAGKNGPWNDPETPVRNTAHWASTFYKAFEISEDERFRQAAVLCCDFLIREENRPDGFTFYCRKTGRAKNSSNGLIGQVWAVEPLLAMGPSFANKPYWEIADRVLSLHHYDESIHGWKTVETDGTVLSVHQTLNQQIWFAVMAFWAGEENPELRRSALDFLATLAGKFDFLEPGLLSYKISQQKIAGGNSVMELERGFQFLSSFKNPIKKNRDLREQSIGYQSFVLHGLALFEDRFPGRLVEILHDLASIKSCINYVLERGPSSYGIDNKYAWSYNPVGIEIAYFLQMFGNSLHLDAQSLRPEPWVEAQVQKHFDRNSGLMKSETNDEQVLAARIYEAINLYDYELS